MWKYIHRNLRIVHLDGLKAWSEGGMKEKAASKLTAATVAVVVVVVVVRHGVLCREDYVE
jgi:hypothetical protein